MDVVLGLVGLTILVVGAELMVRGAVDLALRARISPLVVGLTVVSIGTSAPELLVSLMAAMKGSSAMAVGNVIGSNIANISLVLGACVLIFPIQPDRDAQRIHWPVMMVTAVLFIATLWDDRITRAEGLFLTAVLLFYVTWMVRSSRKAFVKDGDTSVSRQPIWRSLAILLLGIVGLAKGADLFVEGAVGIARILGVSEQLIGVSIVAVGTSLPELVTSLMAAFRKQADISIGNLIGSNIFNQLMIIGVSAMVLPIGVDRSAFRLDLAVMMVIGALLFPFMRFFTRVGRGHGALLLLAYALYIALAISRG